MFRIPRTSTKSYIYDLLHQTTVSFCIVFTTIGTGIYAYNWIAYYKHIWPIRKEEQKLAEEEFLAEGQYKES